MNKKIIILIILIFLFLLFGVSINKKRNIVESTENKTKVGNVFYNESIDDDSGKTIYHIYDETTGEEKKSITDESQLKMYLDNPDYEGGEYDNTDDIIYDYEIENE